MNRSSLAERGREASLGRGRVVSFRPYARVAAARRRPRSPGVVIRLEAERTSPRRATWSVITEWLVLGAVATVLAALVVRGIVP